MSQSLLFRRAQPNMRRGDTAALHCSRDGAPWTDVSLALNTLTGLFMPPPHMAAGSYVGLLRMKHGDGIEDWLPIPLEGLRTAGDSAHSNNRHWSILKPAA